MTYLKNRNGFSHGSGGWKFKIKVLASLVSSEASLLDLQMATLLLLLFFKFYFFEGPGAQKVRAELEDSQADSPLSREPDVKDMGLNPQT